MSNQIFVGDVGTEFRIQITDEGTAVDLSSATDLIISFRKPDGSLLTVSASLYTDGTDGIIFYRSVDGDLDQSGIFKIQAQVTVGSGIYNSSIGSFKVMCNV